MSGVSSKTKRTNYDDCNRPGHPRYALYREAEKAVLDYKELSGRSAIRDSFGTGAHVAERVLAFLQAEAPPTKTVKETRHARRKS